MRCLALVVPLLLGVCAGCQYRPPPAPGAVVSLADSHLMAREMELGPVDRIWRPRDQPDANGRRWWQVDYRVPGDPGRIERVLVDAQSGWTRFPDANYTPMVSPVKRRGPPLFVENAVEVAQGSYLLLINEVPSGSVAAQGLAARAEALNALAREDGVVPLFSLRLTRDGTTQLTYGWQPELDQGTIEDGELTSWVRRQEPEAELVWIDLLSP